MLAIVFCQQPATHRHLLIDIKNAPQELPLTQPRMGRIAWEKFGL
jgi:hypothetical protein